MLKSNVVLQKNSGCWTGGVVCKKTVDGVAKNFGREKTVLNLLRSFLFGEQQDVLMTYDGVG